MLPEINKCIENKDIKTLRYIFIDSLDVDPTFEKYREDYEICKNVEGLFESYKEMGGIIEDEKKWTLEYWEQLKVDLTHNFSQKRFEHMQIVAKVVYSDKVERLLHDRQMRNEQEEKEKMLQELSKQEEYKKEVAGERQLSEEELQEKRIAQKRKELELHNQKVEKEQKAQRERIEAAKKQNAIKERQAGTVSKKTVGIVLIIVVVIVLIVLMVLK